MVALYLDSRYKVKGPFFWAVGTALLAVGLGLLGLQGFLPDALSVVVSNSLILIGYGFVWFGMRRFVERPFSSATWAVGLSVLVLLVTGYCFFIDNVGLRSQVAAFGIFLFSTFIANTLFTSKHGRLCVMLTGVAYSINALVAVMRSVVVLLVPFTQSFMHSRPAFQAFFIFSILFDICVITGQYFMVVNEAKSPTNRDGLIGDISLPES